MQFPFGGGGFPGFDIPFGQGSFPSDPTPASGDVDNTEFYEILQVDRSASDAEIKKQHRKLVLINHPDKGGDEEKFKQINRAYEVLKDPEKREAYDRYGERGVDMDQNGPTAHPFGAMFPDAFNGRRQRDQPKAPDAVHELELPLEDLYSGLTKKLEITRKTSCEPCKGSGSKSGRIPKCRDCNGSGVRMVVAQMGPGMVGHMQKACAACGQSGNLQDSQIPDACGDCKGKGLRTKKKLIEIFVDPGSQMGDKIMFRGEAGKSNKSEVSGDLIFVIKEIPHARFQRKKDHLIYACGISLLEALSSAPIIIKHIDGRSLKYSPVSFRPVRPGDIIKISEEGMPKKRERFERGDLFIKLDIVFPDKIEQNQIDVLKRILPSDHHSKMRAGSHGGESSAPECVEGQIVKYHDLERLVNENVDGSTNDADENIKGMHGVQCAQQ